MSFSSLLHRVVVGSDETLGPGVHDASSRSHSILRLRLHTPAPEGKRRGVEATVSLVDLAGSTHAPPSLLLDVAFCADSSAIGTLDSLDVHDRTYLSALCLLRCVRRARVGDEAGRRLDAAGGRRDQQESARAQGMSVPYTAINGHWPEAAILNRGGA